jgi:hypothetical protein
MLEKKHEQSQQATDGSTAIQAGRDVVVGLSYSEVRQVALDVFRANFIQLIGEAKAAATKRAEEVTDKFLTKLQQENARGVEQARSPDFQYGLFTVQREFARTADPDLGDLLVDLLVDRTKHPDRDILQIVLNESLSVAPKLTINQLSALSAIFFLKYCNTSNVLTLAALGDQLDRFVMPFIDLLPSTSMSFQHLQFAGCGSTELTSSSLEGILGSRYQGLFVKGFNPAALSGCAFFFNPDQKIVTKSPYDPAKDIVRAQNIDHLGVLLEAHRVSPTDAERIKAVFGENLLLPHEIQAKSIELRPYLRRLFDIWDKTSLHNFTLTSVGIALGHANIKRMTGEFADLSIWIQ